MAEVSGKWVIVLVMEHLEAEVVLVWNVDMIIEEEESILR